MAHKYNFITPTGYQIKFKVETPPAEMRRQFDKAMSEGQPRTLATDTMGINLNNIAAWAHEGEER